MLAPNTTGPRTSFAVSVMAVWKRLGMRVGELADMMHCRVSVRKSRFF